MTTNMNIIDITNDVTEIKEDNTITENTNMTTIEKETTVDEAFAEAVSLIPEELIEVEDGKQFERSSETVTIKTLINRYKKGSIQIPKCQRLYVWKESDVDLLADSILHNFPMGVIIIGECEKAKYLLDGLQRITSIVKLLSSDKLSKEDKKEITDYRVVVETIHGMTMDDMNAFIQRCNMGVKMSAATKHRAGLPSSLFNAVVDLAGKPVFREVKTNRTFTTAAHNELIAMHSLLAAAGIPAGKNTAAELCKRLKACEPEIMLKVDEANRLVDFLSDVFFEMPDFLEAHGARMKMHGRRSAAEHLSVKALNVNFAAALFRLMEKNPDVTVGEVQYIVSQIFAGKNAAKDYAATTSRNSADEKSLINRVKVLEQYLAQARKHFAENAEHDAMMQEPQTEQEPQAEPESEQEAEQIFDSAEAPEPSVDEPEAESSTSDLPDEIVLVDDIEGYQKFCAEHEGGSLLHSSGEPEIKFSDFTEADKYDLFLASKANDTEQMDRIIARSDAVMELTAE